MMLRRSVLERIGRFSETMPQCLDIDAWLRCLLYGNWYYLDEELGAFRVHPKATTTRNEESGAGIYDRLHCFERVIARMPYGSLRRASIGARNRALLTMVRKFLQRRKKGKHTPVRGGGAMKKFAMQHPLLMMKVLWQAIRSPA